MQKLLKIKFVCPSILIVAIATANCAAQTKQDAAFINNKVKGLLLGTLIGDAMGGPVEFQGMPEIQQIPNPPKWWRDTTELMDAAAINAAKERIRFREYKHLRPVPEPYAHWTSNAAPGTITDDSRHKIILLHCLRSAVKKKQLPITDKLLAHAYVDWSKSKTITTHSGYDTLLNQWLYESYKVIHWLQGSRKIGYAYPLDRLWNALPTCYGQMVLPPLAALYPGEPEKAYLAAYNIAWFDNAFAKDMNAALVAGLSKALTLEPNKMSNEQLWTEVLNTIRNTDPYDYAKVPWSERETNKWLDLAELYAKDANGSPAKLFERLEKELMYDIKWEAHVPFVVIFSCLKICNYDPLAALQLSMEWGWDSDSYPQLFGAFVGAIYGPDIFKEDMKDVVSKRLELDYDERVSEWVSVLEACRKFTKMKNAKP
jgi:ADP-ribosylglycohydrolase